MSTSDWEMKETIIKAQIEKALHAFSLRFLQPRDTQDLEPDANGENLLYLDWTSCSASHVQAYIYENKGSYRLIIKCEGEMDEHIIHTVHTSLASVFDALKGYNGHGPLTSGELWMNLDKRFYPMLKLSNCHDPAVAKAIDNITNIMSK